MNFLKKAVDFITGKDKQARRGEGLSDEGDRQGREKHQRTRRQEPLLRDSGQADMQGFGWFWNSLRQDEDGDVADEFLVADAAAEEERHEQQQKALVAASSKTLVNCKLEKSRLLTK